MEKGIQLNTIEDELIILTKLTYEILLKNEKPAETIALYTFYYYTAKWQKTNQPKCTTSYVAKGLGWSNKKVIQTKKILLELGLIEDITVREKNNGRITGHYIKLNYIIKKSILEKTHTVENPQGGKTHSVEKPQTNALRETTINALRETTINALSEHNQIHSDADASRESEKLSKEDKIVKEVIEYFNEKAGKKYQWNTKASSSHLKARIKEGFTIDDFKYVIDNQVELWKYDVRMAKFLRPMTLFNSEKFESYLNAPKAKADEWDMIIDNETKQQQKDDYFYNFL